jgi:hypothetical protein
VADRHDELHDLTRNTHHDDDRTNRHHHHHQPRLPIEIVASSGSREDRRCLGRTHESQFDDFKHRGRLRNGLDGYPNSFAALHLGLA